MRYFPIASGPSPSRPFEEKFARMDSSSEDPVAVRGRYTGSR